MWQSVGLAYVGRNADGLELHEEDEELDILHDRLTGEIAKGEMDATVSAQVTLISRFYERIGDPRGQPQPPHRIPPGDRTIRLIRSHRVACRTFATARDRSPDQSVRAMMARWTAGNDRPPWQRRSGRPSPSPRPPRPW